MRHGRTGLTPMGHPGGPVSFPPPSPATAALFAMMTNNTPGTAEAGLGGGGPRPHEGPNESNHFDASFARTSSDEKMAAREGGEYGGGQPLPMGARSALANHLNGGQGGRSMAPHAMGPIASHPPPPQQTSYFPTQPAPQDMYPSQQYAGYPPPPPPLASGAPQPGFGGNQNPLYLLSQASGHTDDAVVAAAALSGLATPGGSYGPPSSMDQMLAQQQQQQQQQGVMPGMTAMSNGNGASGAGQSMSPASSSNGPTPTATKVQPKRGAAKRKKSEVSEETATKKPAAKKGKRGAAAAKVEKDEEDDDFDDGSGGKQESASPQASQGHANETEEEKRKNFLERNRQGEFRLFRLSAREGQLADAPFSLAAALKCRQRKKAWLANLQSKVEMLTTDNDTLNSTVTNLKEEIQSLRAILQAHANCPIAATAAPAGRAPPPPQGGPGYPPQQQQPRY